MKVSFLSVALCALTLSTGLVGQTLQKTLVASGLQRPVGIYHAPGDTSRIFVLEQGNSSSRQAQIRVIQNGSLLPAPFLNIDSLVANSGNERGLLGLAFHPNYAQNGYFYVHYNNSSGTTVISRYQASPPSSNTVSAATGSVLLTYGQPYSNHNGGAIHFGPDGYLYIGLGDGGSANDPGNRAQNINNLLGKILRIDVDTTSPGLPYGIPASNPFVGVAGRDEIWHLGLRNPWQWSFDRNTGDMWIGDVGQNAREEIDFVPAGVGGRNFGWRCMEGTGCTGLSGCACNGGTLTGPIHQYNQSFSTGYSITGGYRYRGCAIAGFEGHYIWADYVTNRIWTGVPNASNTALTGIVDRTGQLGGSISGIAAFGEDASGELYMCGRDNGTVWKITSTTSVNLTVNGTVAPGSTVNFGLSSPGDQNKQYIFGIASGNTPGTALGDGRIVPVNMDPLLNYALANPTTNGIYNPYGTLHFLTASAVVPVTLPNLPILSGQEFHAAFVTLDMAASAGVATVSCGLSVTVQ